MLEKGEADDVNPNYHHHGRNKEQTEPADRPLTPRIPSGLSAQELKGRIGFLDDDEVSYLRDQIPREVCRCVVFFVLLHIRQYRRNSVTFVCRVCTGGESRMSGPWDPK